MTRLICVECERAAPPDAKGWQAHFADVDGDGQDEPLFYCPLCASREFGWIKE